MEHLINSAAAVTDVKAFKIWAGNPLRHVLPHQGIYCGQAVAHSGGYAAIRSWQVDVPAPYVAAVSRPSHNVRSPIFERLLRTHGSPQFFDAERDGADVNPAWLAQFKKAGWRTLLLLQHSEGSADDLLLSAVAFYNVSPELEAKAQQLQHLVMPHLHAVLSRLYAAEAREPGALPKLTPAEDAIASLLSQGKTNKEIAKALAKSDHTIKHQLAGLMRKLDVKNRTGLVRVISASQENAA